MFGFPKRGLVASPAVAIDDDLLSYPPTPKGMPVVDPVALLDRQRDIIRKVKEALPPLGWSEFDVLIRPTLNNVAAFVHLLPASEQDHHRLAGGLLRHLLESARWASQFALNRVFEPFGDPRRRREIEPRWHVAVALAGLLHDIGKPVTDMEVTTVQGHVWNPLEESLYAWAQKNRIERYYIRFRTGRHERHETLPSLMFGQVVARDLQTWLAEPGPEIIQAMSVTLAGGNAGADEKIRALRQFQEKGDFASVAEDKQRSGLLFSNPSMGLPLQNYMIAAMSSLIDDGSWTVNRPGSRLWRLRLPDGDEGLFIVWKKGAQEVEQRARQMHMPGVPSDPVRAAAVLLETGVAIPWPAEAGDNRSYWPIAPEALRGVVLLSVRLRTPDLFRNLVLPEAVEGVLVPRKAEGDAEFDTADASREPDAALAEAVAPAGQAEDVTSPPAAPPPAPGPSAPPALPPKKRESASQRAAPPPSIPEPTPEPSAPAPARPDLAPSRPDTSITESSSLEPTRPSEGAASASPVGSGFGALTGVFGAKAGPRQQLAENWGEAGNILARVVDELVAGRQRWGQALAREEKLIIIPYPGAVRYIKDLLPPVPEGEEPDILALFDMVRDPDPTNPLLRVRVVGKTKGLVLKPVLGQVVLAAVSEAEGNRLKSAAAPEPERAPPAMTTTAEIAPGGTTVAPPAQQNFPTPPERAAAQAERPARKPERLARKPERLAPPPERALAQPKPPAAVPPRLPDLVLTETSPVFLSGEKLADLEEKLRKCASLREGRPFVTTRRIATIALELGLEPDALGKVVERLPGVSLKVGGFMLEEK